MPTPDPARSVIGTHRTGLSEVEKYEEGTVRIMQMLARALHTGSIVAYVGSGLSIDFGFPSWSELITWVWGRYQTIERRHHDRLISDRSRVLWQTWTSSSPKNLRLDGTETALVLLGSLDQDMEASSVYPKHSVTELVRERWKELHGGIEDRRRKLRCDPLAKLIRDLKVQHFFTPNYDRLIKSTWHSVHKPDNLAGPGATAGDAHLREYTVRSDLQDHTVAFACRANQHPTVYYGHGLADGDSGMLVVSDAHYQVRYASTLPSEVAYREGFELLHRAGGLLFIGLGMEERDLMRPMRELLASKREGYEPPLFAILDGRGNTDDKRVERIFFRQAYGVHVLHYDPVSGDERFSRPLCKLLDQIAQVRRTWWQAWRRVPAARRSSFELVNDRTMMRLRYRRPVRSEARVPFPEHAATLIHMRSPAFGSHDVAHHLVDDALATMTGRVFAADLNLTTDLLTMLEAAGEFLAGSPRDKDTTSPLEHLFEALRVEQNTLILAGVDRLLQPEVMRTDSNLAMDRLAEDESTADSNWVRFGVPSGVVEERFFRQLATHAHELKGRVILLASLVPSSITPRLKVQIQGLGDASEAHLQVVRASPPDAETWLRHHPVHPALDPRSEEPVLRDIHRLIRGEHTALEQLHAWLEDPSLSKRSVQLPELAVQLSTMQWRRRSQHVFRTMVRQMRESGGEQAYDVLRLLAHFTSPTTPGVLVTLLRAKGQVNASESQTREQLQFLEQRGFCFRTTCKEAEDTWAPVHGARQWLGEALRGYRGEAWSGLPQRFGLPGFTRDPDYERLISPQSLKGLFDKVASLSHRARSEFKDRGATSRIARTHFRAAVDLVRTHLGLSALRRCEELYSDQSESERVPPMYPRYHKLLLELANLLQDSHAEHGYSHHLTDKELGEQESWPNAWLYAGEVIWLTNELALIPYTEGQIQDAVPHFRKSFRAQQLVDGSRKSWRWAREQMFDGAVLIDRAQLAQALRALKEARAVAREKSVGAVDLELRCDGYLGLCLHLMGDYERALDHYGAAIKGLRDSRNFRALSLAYRLRGDLYRHQGRSPDAKDDLDASVRAADRGRHPDLRMAARLSQVVLWASRERNESHRLSDLSFELARRHQKLDSVERYALSIGSKRLEVHCNLARIVLQQMGGDLEHAWNIARKNLAETRSYGLKLDFIRMLALAGYVSWKRGKLRSELLSAARARAEKAGLVHVLQRIRRLESSGL